MNFDIREMISEDIARVSEELRQERTLDFLPWESPAVLRALIERNPGLCKTAVASESGQVVGIFLAGDTGLRGMLHHLFVIPAFRRCGIGERLVQEVVRSFRSSAYTSRRVFAHVYGSNSTMIRILMRNGFILNPALDKELPFVVPMHADL